MVGCGTVGHKSMPKVYQAWGARYHYNLENRRMISMYDNKKIGRVRGRDEWGRIDYDRYWVTNPFKGEDLLISHHAKLDANRSARFEMANKEFIKGREQDLLEMVKLEGQGKKNSNPENEAVNLSDSDTGEFLPAPFLPEGINMAPDEPVGDAFIPTGIDGGVDSPPEGAFPALPPTPDAPSPFAPLPPL
jgi:hypothetical protein